MAFQNNFKQYLNSKSQAETEALTPKEMHDLQEALTNSRDTAKNEKERREYSRQAIEIQKHFYKSNTTGNTSSGDIFDDSVKEKSFTPKRWSKPPKSPINISKVEQEASSSTQDQNEFEIRFPDLPEPSGKPLDIVFHTPVFDLPVNINPEYQKYTMKQRAKLLSRHFTRIDVLISKLAKQSFFRAPYPKPILPSNKCKNSLFKNGNDEGSGSLDDFVDQLPVQDLYVSRAGRQIKRKIYTEDAEADSDPDFIFSNKKNKADDSDTKITLDTPFLSEENHNEEKSEPKVLKTKKETPKRPTPVSIKRYTNRAELMVSKGKEDEEKKNQQQEQMDIFQTTLTKLDDNDDDKFSFDDSPVKVIPDEASFVRKRVPPPNPMKKGGRPRKTTKQEATDKNDTRTESPPGSPVLKRYASITKHVDAKSKQRLKQQKSKDNSASEEITITRLEKTACPICNKEFLQSEIVNHAARCGIEDEIFEEPVRSSTVKTILCDLCDREFAINTDYEVHVKQCIAAKITSL